jgi:hypothetical protein
LQLPTAASGFLIEWTAPKSTEAAERLPTFGSWAVISAAATDEEDDSHGPRRRSRKWGSTAAMTENRARDCKKWLSPHMMTMVLYTNIGI